MTKEDIDGFLRDTFPVDISSLSLSTYDAILNGLMRAIDDKALPVLELKVSKEFFYDGLFKFNLYGTFPERWHHYMINLKDPDSAKYDINSLQWYFTCRTP